jgi:hypothetical protein
VTDGPLAPGVAGADDLSGPQAAAGDPEEAGGRPVAAAVRRDVADAGRPAELATHHHRHVLEKSALFQVEDQGAEGFATHYRKSLFLG